MPVVDISHATVSRNGRIILDDVSLCIEEHQHIAIIGANGAGKSTLAGVMSMGVHPLYRENFSRILFGQRKWHIHELRKKLGIVSQPLQTLCSTTYTVTEIVISGLFSSIGLDFSHHVTPEHDRQAHDIMEKFNIIHLKDKSMNTLSSGEARRALIARACINDPSLLILDEAVTSLDFPSRAQYRSTLRTLADTGKTLVLITHELSEIITEIERVIVMKDGRIMADGPKEDILTEEILADAYGQKVYIDHRDGLYSAWC
ncbi:ABC transporter ATP-binding protein [Parasphaerochaeta coccoides]|nr:ATP-binding cassette domain-containing protein [Parasphaerochaeta coccoides]